MSILRSHWSNSSSPASSSLSSLLACVTSACCWVREPHQNKMASVVDVIQACHSGFKMSTSARARFQMTTWCLTLHMGCIRLFLQGSCDTILTDSVRNHLSSWGGGVNSVNIFQATFALTAMDGTLDSWADHYAQRRWRKGPHLYRNKPQEDW